MPHTHNCVLPLNLKQAFLTFLPKFYISFIFQIKLFRTHFMLYKNDNHDISSPIEVCARRLTKIFVIFYVGLFFIHHIYFKMSSKISKISRTKSYMLRFII